MTPPQKSKYWRRWGVVSRANHWRMISRRLDPAAVTTGSAAHDAVWQTACRLAATDAVGVTPEHLRHACHRVALGGRDKSHTQFTNRDFDALLDYWGDERNIRGLLLEPFNLSSLISADQHAAQKVRERQVRWLRRDCLGGYVMSESERLFGTKDWEQLGDADLARLHDHLRARPRAWKRTERKKAPDTDVFSVDEPLPANCPF